MVHASSFAGRQPHEDENLGIQNALSLYSPVAALLIESTLCAGFALMYYGAVRELLSRDQPHAVLSRSRILLFALTVIMLFAMLHLGLTILQTIAFTVAIGTIQYFLYVTQTFVASGIMLYQIILVWDKRRDVVMIGALAGMASALSGYAWTGILGPFSVLLVSSFYLVSFIANIVSSALVVWGRLCGHSTLNASTLGDLLDALLDSAAIYSIASVAFVLPRLDYLTCIAILPQLIGIAYSVVVVRISRAAEEGNIAIGDSAPLLV
ncbi:hypothetical protein C8Q76DRAFT_801838 [Earliella scabrosa]|nr:hypothetical protein C8Q76DRAFT_801838 [Earliella scabrosa]